MSLATRFYKLGKVPAGFTWDEAAVGYNAYTILHWGKDEWGKTMPITFKSFGDDKNPIHVYLTVPFVGIFGLNEWATRASSAFFGVLVVFTSFFLAKTLFKSRAMGLITALFLSISPFNIQFSRFNHELNFAVFFFAIGVYLFYKGLKRKNWLLLVSFLFLGIDLLTYQSAKVVTPLLVLLLIILNFKKLLTVKKYFIIGSAVYLFFVGLLFIKPQLLGGARLKQTSIGTPKVVLTRYFEYFKLKFLFISGDDNPRHSIQNVGTFYWLDLPLLLIGLLGIIRRLIVKKDSNMLFLLAWVFLAPLPGAASSISAHAARAMFITGSWAMVSAYGTYVLISIFANKYYKIAMCILLVIASGFFLSRYLRDYFGKYNQRYAIEWIYGMRDIVKYADKFKFNKVYMTESMRQPYIFFLYYLKIPLPEYLETVKYNQTKSAPSNVVSSFKNYQFIWNEYYSVPNMGELYVVRPSVYDGLFQKISFEVVKLIKYPNGTDAFYMITGQ